MIITPLEIIYLIVASLVVGYIFSGIIKSQAKEDVLKQYTRRFDWENFKLAVIVAAPGVIIHELAHKFVAMGFGLNAIFQIWPTGLAIGVILKLLGSPFLLVAPGYVSIGGGSGIFPFVLTAFAGPFTNLLLWIGAKMLSKHVKNASRKTAIALLLTENMNKWLFIFNMIPVPPLDGSKVLYPLFGALF